MKTQPEMTKLTIRQRITGCLIIGMIVGLLLSACDTNAKASAKQNNTLTPVPTATINPTTINEVNTQLQTFQQWIALMQQYKGDVTRYQQQYNEDQQALHDAHTDAAYKNILTTLSNQINAIKLPALKVEAKALHQTLKDQLSAWRSQHTYYDKYDGKTYQYGYEYTDTGVVGDNVYAINTAKTEEQFQQIIEDFNTYLTNFRAMTENASDSTPYNQQHKTDLELIKKYGHTQGIVLVVSLYEQAMRVFKNGQLVKSFLVTTGSQAHPSLPGAWWVEQKESPTTFKSLVPEGDPDYYPPTPINYAMLYHSGGYNIHDSWWRGDYGPGTQFPHIDSTGNRSASQGSHGCINLSKDNAGWVYNFASKGTPVIVY